MRKPTQGSSACTASPARATSVASSRRLGADDAAEQRALRVEVPFRGGNDAVVGDVACGQARQVQQQAPRGLHRRQADACAQGPGAHPAGGVAIGRTHVAQQQGPFDQARGEARGRAVAVAGDQRRHQRLRLQARQRTGLHRVCRPRSAPAQRADPAAARAPRPTTRPSSSRPGISAVSLRHRPGALAASRASARAGSVDAVSRQVSKVAVSGRGQPGRRIAAVDVSARDVAEYRRRPRPARAGSAPGSSSSAAMACATAARAGPTTAACGGSDSERGASISRRHKRLLQRLQRHGPGVGIRQRRPDRRRPRAMPPRWRSPARGRRARTAGAPVPPRRPHGARAARARRPAAASRPGATWRDAVTVPVQRHGDLTFDRHGCCRRGGRAGSRAWRPGLPVPPRRGPTGPRSAPRGPGRPCGYSGTSALAASNSASRASRATRRAAAWSVEVVHGREQRAGLVLADRRVVGADEFVDPGRKAQLALARARGSACHCAAVARQQHQVHEPGRHHHAQPVAAARVRRPRPRPPAPGSRSPGPAMRLAHLAERGVQARRRIRQQRLRGLGMRHGISHRRSP